VSVTGSNQPTYSPALIFLDFVYDSFLPVFFGFLVKDMFL